MQNAVIYSPSLPSNAEDVEWLQFEDSPKMIRQMHFITHCNKTFSCRIDDGVYLEFSRETLKHSANNTADFGMSETEVVEIN